MITAIRATSRTLADFLQTQFASDPDLGSSFGGGGTMRVFLNTPAEMTGNRSGLSVWLYRVARDPSTLNSPPERISATRMRPAPFPVRLHYLLTAISNSTAEDAPATEQVILGKALQALHDHPHLSGVDLRDDFEGSDTIITSRFESLTIDDLGRVWEALARSYRTSVSYEVTVVDIEAPVRDRSGPPVLQPMVEPAVIVGAP